MDKPAGTRRPWTAQELLEQTLPHVRAHGLAELTLRGAAESIGTSHKVLLHYFGSREQYIAAVLRRVRARLIAETRDDDAVVTLERIWQWYSDNPQDCRLLAQGLGLGLAEPQSHGQTAQDSLTQFNELAGPADTTLARLIRAAVRGLLLDKIASRETAGADAAFALLLDLIRSGALQERAHTYP